MGKIFPDGIKSKILIPCAAALGLILIVFGGAAGGGSKTKKEEYTDVGYYTSYLEDRIEELCESVEGINGATVLLTLDSSTEYVYGTDANADFLIVKDSDGEHAIKLCEIYPRIRGVAVVCTGGDSAAVREKVVKLLSASLGIPSNKIEVAGGG